MTVKFLGLHIDREWKWKEQIAAAIGKGREWLKTMQKVSKELRQCVRMTDEMALPCGC